MIVISNPTSTRNEIEIIHSLFHEGLELLHIRKPDFSEIEMAQFIHQIKMDFRKKLVLHSHHQLASDFGINRIHFTGKDRKNNTPERLSKTVRHISTSTHSIEEFNGLSDVFEYAFLSPVFPSISKKNHHSEMNLFEAIKNRTNFNTKLIALGGMDSINIKRTATSSFDDIALLGSIWNSNNPIEKFKLCQQISLSY